MIKGDNINCHLMILFYIVGCLSGHLMLQELIIDTPSPFAMMCQAMAFPLTAGLEFGAKLDTKRESSCYQQSLVTTCQHISAS